MFLPEVYTEDGPSMSLSNSGDKNICLTMHLINLGVLRKHPPVRHVESDRK